MILGMGKERSHGTSRNTISIRSSELETPERTKENSYGEMGHPVVLENVNASVRAEVSRWINFVWRAIFMRDGGGTP